MTFLFAAGAALLAVLASGEARAAVALTIGSAIPSPALFNGFEGMPAALDNFGDHSEGGITVQYIGTYTGIATTVQAYDGALSWYARGGGTGYTRVIRTGGGDFTDLSFAGGSGFLGAPGGNLLYEVLNDGAVVASGDAGPLAFARAGWTLFRINGGAFDEVRLQGAMATAFSPHHLEGGIYDAFAANVAAGVPEPGVWAVMILGFGGVGLVLRSQRRSTGRRPYASSSMSQ